MKPDQPDQPDPEQRLRESWRANADAWTDAVREGRIESRRLGTDEALLETITARAPGPGPARVLDVGCGEGWLARALEPHGFDVVGIDGSEALIRSAERLGGGSFQVVGYDELVADPGVVPGPFDAVVCNFSLLSEHIAPVLRALADRLAPDNPPSPAGVLIIQTVHPFTAAGEEPYRDGWREETFGGFGDDFATPMPWYYRTVGSWIRELRASGLGVMECREPLDPRTGRPLSLIMAARRTPAARHSRGPAGRG